VLLQSSEKLISELTSFGLTGNEAKVFIALVQFKKANAHEIAKLANISRQEVYRVLPNLEKAGIIKVIIANPTEYETIDPNEALAQLIQLQQQKLKMQLHELNEKKAGVGNELKAAEGRSVGMGKSTPVKFVLISGRKSINEKIEDMLRNAKNSVLWVAPKIEVKRAVAYGRDKLIQNCARRNVNVRIITEITDENLEEVEKLDKICDLKHSDGVTSGAMIVDSKELIIASAIYSSENKISSELMNELWTNDSSPINLMNNFFEKVWNASVPGSIGIQAVRSGRQVESFSIIRGKGKVDEKLHQLVSAGKSKLFLLSYVNNESIRLLNALLDETQKKDIRLRFVTIPSQENREILLNLAARVNLHVLKERPVSLLVTDSECLFSSSPLLQIPNEVIWSSDQNVVNMFWVLAEETWKFSEDLTGYSLRP